MLISSFGLYGLRKPSEIIHRQAITFIVSSVLMMLIMIRKERKQKQQIGINNSLYNRKAVCIVQIIAIILLTPLLLSAIQLFLKTGSISEIRSSFYGQEYEGRYLFTFLFRQMPIGIVEGLIIYYTYCSFHYHKPKLLLYAALNALLTSFISGGRYELILLIISVIVTFINSSAKIKVKSSAWIRKYKKLLLFLIVVLCVSGAIITLNARSSGIFDGLITYSAGSMSFWDYIYSNPAKFNLNEQLHGYLTFSAIIEPIVIVFKVLGLTTNKVPSWHFSYYCQPFYNISATSNAYYFNNNTSILYFLYHDFGNIGPFIGGILIGIVFSWLYNNRNNGKLSTTIIVNYASIMLLLTPMYYKFFSCSAIITITTIYICARKSRVINNIKGNQSINKIAP